MLVLSVWACAEPTSPRPRDPLTDDTAAPTSTPPRCADGTAPVALPETEGSGLYDRVGDFTVALADGGAFTWSASHDGCETLLFVPSRPVQEAGSPPLWSRDVDELLRTLPDSTRVFFVSNAPDRPGANADLDQIQDGLDAALAALPPRQREAWSERLFVVADRAADLDGWVGEAARAPGFGFGVDRSRRLRWIGSFADGSRYDAGIGWFQSNLAFAAHEAIYWEFEARREARLEAQQATVVPVFAGERLEDPGWAGVRGTATFRVPDDLARYDQLDLDLTLGCVGDGEFGECPAWDYLVDAWLCEGTDPTDCPTELGRWITTYHREGRWTVDARHVLPLLRPGEERTVAFYTQQPYETTLSLRFFDDPEATVAPLATSPLFRGGTLGAAYNDERVPVEVPVPAGAEKVELTVLISGHGGEAPWNCAEFCVTDHHFRVNGVEHVVSLSGAGSPTGCQDDVERGTVPNQYGTWFYGRSNWCPGREVEPIRIDVTADVTPGEPATITYEGLYRGADYPGVAANIDLSSWLVSWGR